MPSDPRVPLPQEEAPRCQQTQNGTDWPCVLDANHIERHEFRAPLFSGGGESLHNGPAPVASLNKGAPSRAGAPAECSTLCDGTYHAPLCPRRASPGAPPAEAHDAKIERITRAINDVGSGRVPPTHPFPGASSGGAPAGDPTTELDQLTEQEVDDLDSAVEDSRTLIERGRTPDALDREYLARVETALAKIKRLPGLHRPGSPPPSGEERPALTGMVASEIGDALAAHEAGEWQTPERIRERAEAVVRASSSSHTGLHQEHARFRRALEAIAALEGTTPLAGDYIWSVKSIVRAALARLTSASSSSVPSETGETARLRADAARWQFVRTRLTVLSERTMRGTERPFLRVAIGSGAMPRGLHAVTPDELDAAIDAARAALSPTPEEPR
jgi:hypothetical protein